MSERDYSNVADALHEEILEIVATIRRTCGDADAIRIFVLSINATKKAIAEVIR